MVMAVTRDERKAIPASERAGTRVDVVRTRGRNRACRRHTLTAAKTRDMLGPLCAGKRQRVPSAALWLTNIVVQLLVISIYWSYDGGLANAQSDERDVADPLCLRRSLRHSARAAAKPMA